MKVRNLSKLNKIIAFMMVTAILLSSFSVSAFAADDVVTYKSNDVYVEMNRTKGVLRVYGKGPMENYTTSEPPVWKSQTRSYSKVVIEEGVTSIGDCTFSNSMFITSLEIPSSVTYIGEFAFNGSTDLRKVVIPGSVKKIEYGAFMMCTQLSDVSLGYGLEYIGDRVFCDDKAIEKLVIPESVKHIGAYALSIRTGAEITVPKELEYIGENAFQNTKFASQLPNGLNVYSGCTLTYKGSFNGDELVIPDGVKYLSEKTLSANATVKSVKLPGTLTTIYKRALFNCTNLFEITIPDSVEFIDDEALGFVVSGSYTAIGYPFTIYGHAGHESQRYADKYGFDFVCLHEAGGYAYVPDCEVGGDAVVVCKWCGEEMGKETFEKGSHKFGEKIKVDATCIEAGYTSSVCSVCGLEKKENVSEAKGHKFGSFPTLVKAPTCTEEGLFAYVCTECGAYDGELTVIKSEHKRNSEWKTEKEATCTENGEQALYCTVCGELLETREIEAAGHVQGAAEVFVLSDNSVEPPAEGFCGIRCKKCGIICDYRYYITGDIDGDGFISMQDLKLLKKHLMALLDGDPYLDITADVDSDGEAGMKDVKAMKKILMGL